ncbi:Panacea domain-containing protein [Spiroplasma endosymbiont of Eupeodes luniger]|uniref:Panacea domain-containing protein n=1 Tax=Spiroplasma endosymbiont of Eupeodes luniger TaxID=3066300 RepID=UPI0030CADC15
MFNEKFEAWILGPVLRRVYLHTRDFGLNFSYVLSTKVITENNAIKNISVDKKIISDLTDQEIINVIDKTWEQYGNMSPRDLVDESHKTSPWIKARNGIQENEPSDNQISLV